MRLVRRKVKDKNRFFVQLVCEGTPYQKTHLGDGVVGVDIDPSTVAAVGEGSALLEQFCAELAGKQREIRRLSRKMGNQRKSNNPDNYNPDGTIKPRPKQRQVSISSFDLHKIL